MGVPPVNHAQGARATIITVKSDPLNDTTAGISLITGAGGQDGYFLTRRLLSEGWTVHALVHSAEHFRVEDLSTDAKARLQTHQFDLLEPGSALDLISRVQPDELYNLAGQSSVAKSLSDPLLAWRTNAGAVIQMLECIRRESPQTRFYQASSTEMFGAGAGSVMPYNERSALNPQSPYATAKAAAHLLCHSYREAYGLRIASGILSNHESHRRPESFLSRKVVGHVLNLMKRSPGEVAQMPPLMMGNLKVERDWGFAPDYVDGMCAILRQIKVRAQRTGAAQADVAANYRDYLLATGHTHAVWELVDCAFTIGGFELDWQLDGKDPAAWRGHFRSTGKPAVMVDPKLVRAAEPLTIQVDPSRAREELGWAPREGLEVFLRDMFTELPRATLAGRP